MSGESFVSTLVHSKTNQRGDLRPEDVKPLVGSAAVAMTEWLEVLKAHGIQEGKIFRRIRKGGQLGEPLAPAAVRDIVKERCVLAGIEGRFSAHSLRAGFVTEAGKQNMPLPETMAMTGHQSVADGRGVFQGGERARVQGPPDARRGLTGACCRELLVATLALPLSQLAL